MKVKNISIINKTTYPNFFHLIWFLILAFPIYIKSQTPIKQGTLNLFWGWNKDYFSNSKIKFSGNGYEFTLYDVSAEDKFLPFGKNPHLTLGRVTIPQTNFRLGYFIKDNVEFTFGIDHMKYVMIQNQEVQIDGSIAIHSEYDDKYNSESIVLTDDFLKFEHTDGLNYGFLELSLYENLNPWLGMTSYKNFNLYGYVGGSLGLVVPKTNTTLLNHERYDAFHLSGFGMGGKVGFQSDFFNWISLRYEWKIGYINMPWVRTTQYKSDRAQHSFFFSENIFLFGLQHRF